MCDEVDLFSVVLHVLLPVAMVGCSITRVSLQLVGDRSDPDGSEAHPLNVVQLKRQSVW